MDTFFAIPTSTSITPFSPKTVIVEDIIRPIIPIRTLDNIMPRVVTNFGVTTVLRPYAPYYYDSGIGENELARHETNVDLRYRFLDKWLYENYPEILRLLKVNGTKVTIISDSEAQSNDISKNTEDELNAKSDFIGHEILTLHKNYKILDELCRHNNMKWYDLPHNHHYVRKEQAKYVLKKLHEMQSPKLKGGKATKHAIY